MFRNFRIHSPVGGRPSAFFGPSHVLFFSGWMNDMSHVRQFVNDLTTEETAIIRRLAFHDECFTRHKTWLIPFLTSFHNLERLFLVSELILEDDPDLCLGPLANPPDRVEFVAMPYVAEPNSSPTRRQVPYSALDKVFEVEREFQELPNAMWPSSIRVDMVSVKRNGRLRGFNQNIYGSLSVPQEFDETGEQENIKLEYGKGQGKTSDVQQPEFGNNSIKFENSMADASDPF